MVSNTCAALLEEHWLPAQPGQAIICSFQPAQPQELFECLVNAFWDGRSKDQAQSDVCIMFSAMGWAVPSSVARRYYAKRCPN
jgi:hypothetical protein